MKPFSFIKAAVPAAAAFAFFSAPLLAGDEVGGNDIGKELAGILEKMETVEKMLAKTKVPAGSEEMKKIIEDLEGEIREGKLKQDEVIGEIDRQLKVVVEKMKDIDQRIDELIQKAAKMSRDGGSGMESKDGTGQSGGKKRGEQKGDLKELRKEDEQKEGEEGSATGEDPAKKPYSASGKEADGGVPRAKGEGHWGDLPPKVFLEAMASGKVKVPPKYELLIRKYMEMMAKKAAEGK